MGEVHEFSTGAVRGTAQVPRYDLVPLVGLRRLADTSAEGAQKFGAGNWLKGIPSSNLVSHALNHIFLYLDGDRSEDHLGHAIWGLAAIAHNEERRPDMHDLQGQREVPGSSSPTSDPISAEIDGLPSVATAAPSGAHHSPDPTAVNPPVKDAAFHVLDRIVREKVFPDGQPVGTAFWLPRTGDQVQIQFDLHGKIYRATPISVCGKSDILVERVVEEVLVEHDDAVNTGRVLSNEVRKLRDSCPPSGAHHSPDPTAVEPSFADEALSAVQEFFGPSGPREGLQEPQTPQSPMDAGYDDWEELVKRVNALTFCPWWDNRAGWCARSPVTKRVEIFGRSDADRAAAYRWVHQLLDQSSMVATQPPSAPAEETSS